MSAASLPSSARPQQWNPRGVPSFRRGSGPPVPEAAESVTGASRLCPTRRVPARVMQASRTDGLWPLGPSLLHRDGGRQTGFGSYAGLGAAELQVWPSMYIGLQQVEEAWPLRGCGRCRGPAEAGGVSDPTDFTHLAPRAPASRVERRGCGDRNVLPPLGGWRCGVVPPAAGAVAGATAYSVANARLARREAGTANGQAIAGPRKARSPDPATPSRSARCSTASASRWSTVVALLISNVPEGIADAADMQRAGRRPRLRCHSRSGAARGACLVRHRAPTLGCRPDGPTVEGEGRAAVSERRGTQLPTCGLLIWLFRMAGPTGVPHRDLE